MTEEVARLMIGVMATRVTEEGVGVVEVKVETGGGEEEAAVVVKDGTDGKEDHERVLGVGHQGQVTVALVQGPGYMMMIHLWQEMTVRDQESGKDTIHTKGNHRGAVEGTNLVGQKDGAIQIAPSIETTTMQITEMMQWAMNLSLPGSK